MTPQREKPTRGRPSGAAEPPELLRDSLLAQFGERAVPRVLFLVAPSGYGKSVLLGQLAAQAGLHLRLEAQPGGREQAGGWEQTARLIESFIEGVGQLDQEAAGALRELHDKAALTGSQAAARLKGRPELLITVDRAEELNAESETWLLALAKELPQPHRLAVAARVLDSPEVSYLVATRQALFLGPSELEFQPDELAQLCLDPQQAERWPLAVALGLRPVAGTSLGELLSALFRGLPASLQAALPRLAPFTHWTNELPTSLGLTLAPDWIAQLLRARLPVLRLESGEYQPHPEFLNVLAHALDRSPQERADTYRQAAHWLESQGETGLALGALLQGRLETEAIALAEARAAERSAQGQYLQTVELTAQLPEHLLATSPLLLAWRGRALIETQQIREGLLLLETLRADPVQGHRALVPLALGEFRSGRLTEAEHLAEQAIHVAAKLTTADRVTLKILQGNIRREQGQPEVALDILLDALRDSREARRPVEEGHALLALNVTYLRLGQADAALEVAMQAKVILEQLGQTSDLIIPLLNTAVLLGVRDETARAKELLLRALELAEEHRAYTLTSIHFVLGDLLRGEGEPEQAEYHFRQAVDHARTSGRASRQLMAELSLSELLRQQGREEEANRQVINSRQLLEVRPTVAESPLLVTLSAFHEGQLALSQGDLTLARQHFSQFANPAGELKSYRARAEMHLAEIARREGTLTQEHLDRYMASRQELGGWVHLQLDLRVIRPVLEEAVKRGWYAEELRPLLAPPGGAQRPRLFIRTLGELSLWLDGKPLELRGSSPRRAQELLALLALLPGPTSGDLQRALIGAGRGDHRNALSTARQSLARATGMAEPLQQDLQRRYQFSPELEVITDIQQLRQAVTQGDLEEIRALWPTRAEFLPTIESAWAADLRETDMAELLEQARTLLEEVKQKP